MMYESLSYIVFWQSSSGVENSIFWEIGQNFEVNSEKVPMGKKFWKKIRLVSRYEVTVWWLFPTLSQQFSKNGTPYSWLVDHCFTSHYSSFCDVQIDRILHTLIIVCNIVSLQSVGLSYLCMITCWWIIPRSLLPVAWCGFAKFCHY